MEEDKPREKSSSVTINFRLSTKDDLRISKIAKSARMTKSEVIRKLVAAGFENTDYKNVSDKYDVLLDRIQRISDYMAGYFKKVSYEIDMLDKRITQLNYNIIRANIFLDEFSLRLIPGKADYIDMRNRITIRHTEFKDMRKTDAE